MGTETLEIANIILRWAPYCLLPAGVAGLLFVLFRWLTKSNKDDRPGETADRAMRVVGFVSIIAVMAGGAVSGVRHFIATNPGQTQIEQNSSGSMVPSNDWWKPIEIGTNEGVLGERGGVPGGTQHAGEVIRNLQSQAGEARERGDEESAQELERRSEQLVAQNATMEYVAKILGFFNPLYKPLLNTGTDTLQNLNADINTSDDAYESAIKSMQWFR